MKKFLMFVVALGLVGSVGFGADPKADVKAENNIAETLSVPPLEAAPSLNESESQTNNVNFNALKTEFENSVSKEPVIWSVMALVASLFGLSFGKKATTNIFTCLSNYSSGGEAFGIVLITVGVLAVANGAAACGHWAPLPFNLIAGGILSTVYGIGFAAEAAEKRKGENEKK